MNILRTPTERFAHLPDYDFDENFIDVGIPEQPIRMHYVDYGDADAPVILMMHGEPTWSFLYRHMIKIAQKAGYRVIAPDLIGFGKSDKFDSQDAYTYASHLGWLEKLLDRLKLNDIRLICQDWGGLLGLRLVSKFPDLFAAVVAANTMLPTGGHKPADAFLQWQTFSQESDTFPIGSIVNNATVNELPADVIAAYDAPFPSEAHKCGARKFPMLVPITDDDPESHNNRAAWKALSKFERPFMTAFSDSDPVTAGLDKIFHKIIPGCQDQPHTTLKGGGHFLQEDVSEELIYAALVCFDALKTQVK